MEHIARGRQRTGIGWKVKTDLKELQTEFHQKLIDQGLNEDEAQSLLDVWGPGLFDRQGITLIYRISQDTYDQWLPLECRPEPEKIVRLGLVVHHHLEPELEANIKALISELGSDAFAVRQKAEDELRAIGAPALQFIAQHGKNAPLEVQLRCRKLLQLEKLEAQLEELVQQRSQPQDKSPR